MNKENEHSTQICICGVIDVNKAVSTKWNFWSILFMIAYPVSTFVAIRDFMAGDIWVGIIPKLYAIIYTIVIVYVFAASKMEGHSLSCTLRRIVFING